MMLGNICGAFSSNYLKDKSLVIGSHTDSVKNGGQFDGSIGVYMALKSAEKFKNSNHGKQYGNLKIVIYACEESTRFKSACLGSYYLSKEMSYDELSKLRDDDGITFDEAVLEYKQCIISNLKDYGIDLNNVKFVDRVLSEEEVAEAIEAHIEQAEILYDNGNSIGMVDSIGKPLRGTVKIKGENSLVTSAKVITKLNELAKNSKTNGEETLRITVPQFDTLAKEGNVQVVENNVNASENSEFDLVEITAFGENNHSGSTPMDKRKDAVIGLSELILKLNDFQKRNPSLQFEFLGSQTKKWGANQVQNNANLVIKVFPQSMIQIVREFCDDISEECNVNFEVNSIESAVVPVDKSTEFFVDVRQQYPAVSEKTREYLYNTLKSVQEEVDFGKDSVSFKVSSKGDPILTSKELLENIKNICDKKNYPCQIMHSWPGHDLACVLPKTNTVGQKILFFIPSQGGSHNPNETTSREAIEVGTDVYTTLVSQRMNKLKELYEKENELSL